MSNQYHKKFESSRTRVYQFRIEGHLDVQWINWLEDLTVTLEDNGDTIITASVVDQATLHGLFKKVRDLGLVLVSVNQVYK